MPGKQTSGGSLCSRRFSLHSGHRKLDELGTVAGEGGGCGFAVHRLLVTGEARRGTGSDAGRTGVAGPPREYILDACRLSSSACHFRFICRLHHCRLLYVGITRKCKRWKVKRTRWRAVECVLATRLRRGSLEVRSRFIQATKWGRNLRNGTFVALDWEH